MAPTKPQPSHTLSQEELVELASFLTEADERLLTALIAARHAADLSQRQVAELLGIKQSSVAAFERYDNDPRLSTIRRYALAVGAIVDHRVFAYDGCFDAEVAWHQLGEVDVSIMPPAEAVAVDAPADMRSTAFAVAA